jgi:hypothetical protein
MDMSTVVIFRLLTRPLEFQLNRLAKARRSI